MIFNCYELSFSGKEVNLNHLNDEEKIRTQLLLNKFENLIFKEGDQLTNTDSITHEIKYGSTDKCETV